jgi:MFS transporter, DHA1 family, multidrug resistance protein
MATPRTPSTLHLTIVLGILSAFGPLSIDMYLPGFPTITNDLGGTAALTQLTLSVFLIGLALGQSIYGPLADRYGRRAPLVAGYTIYTLASIGCALAPTIEWLIAMRLLQALGGCAGMVIPRSVVRDLFDARESARMLSFLMLVMGLAPITAPLIGGQLLIFFGWRSIFWFLTLFGLACITLVLTQLPETLPTERRTQASMRQSLQTYGSLLRERRFLGFALAGGFMSAGMFAYISGSPFVVITHFGVPPERYGLIFGSIATGLIACSQINRYLLARHEGEVILRTALTTVVFAGAVLVAVAASGAGGLLGLLAPLLVCVAAQGFIQPNTTAAALAPHGRVAGSASALLGTLQFGVNTISGTLVGILHDGTPVPMAAVIACCMLLAFGAFTLLAHPTRQAVVEV